MRQWLWMFPVAPVARSVTALLWRAARTGGAQIDWQCAFPLTAGSLDTCAREIRKGVSDS